MFWMENVGDGVDENGFVTKRYRNSGRIILKLN